MGRRATSYLYLRGTTWWLKIQTPGQAAIRRSLRTSDRLQAEVKALPEIQRHKQALLMLRSFQASETVPDPRYDPASGQAFRFEPGEDVVHADGSRTRATRDHVVHFDADGHMRVEPNVRTSTVVVKAQTVWQCSREEALAMGWSPERVATMTFKKSLDAKPKATGVDPDLKLLDDFLDLQPRTKHYEADARNTWKRWKTFIGDKPLSKCTRDDGRAFVKHLRSQVPPPAPVTVRKWLSLLKAPIAHGLPKHDPRQDVFHNLQTGVAVQTRRIPLDEADMALFRENAFPKMGRDEKLLWMMMATTGMRQSECDSLVEEFQENGIRFWMIGVTPGRQAKTTTSMRRVPIPDALIPMLPERITGRVFSKPMVIINKNVGRWMERVGITDPRKVPYSLRHRAHDRMRAAACPRDIQLQIVGHDKNTIHDDYGEGHPMPILKDWVEKIGF
ncbi:hypothetical protein [Methylobacterium sp. 13MFTsu3.1M2]|uniref:hypothetical protein n=1 Tax=Methylobacterium sp. 13MFTsu3.1M2 TaxID=1502776 RepID=UPI0008E17BB8|nr:hypothetical protein [Methylobacterium sp. 13MFTsu3.1M2]SFE10254.1 Site-specific recombinase XerD [Methylobacterium sp. 13MFTsu3.1M2]